MSEKNNWQEIELSVCFKVRVKVFLRTNASEKQDLSSKIKVLNSHRQEEDQKLVTLQTDLVLHHHTTSTKSTGREENTPAEPVSKTVTSARADGSACGSDPPILRTEDDHHLSHAPLKKKFNRDLLAVHVDSNQNQQVHGSEQ